jgi:hypothetical protein
VRVLTGGLERHEIHHVDDADLQVWKMSAKQIHRCQSFERRTVAGACHHDIRVGALIVARLSPDADSGGAVQNRRVHVEPLQRGLLAGHDDIPIMAAPQAMAGPESNVLAFGGR